jgi:hypothetical protein
MQQPRNQPVVGRASRQKSAPRAARIEPATRARSPGRRAATLRSGDGVARRSAQDRPGTSRATRSPGNERRVARHCQRRRAALRRRPAEPPGQQRLPANAPSSSTGRPHAANHAGSLLALSAIGPAWGAGVRRMRASTVCPPSISSGWSMPPSRRAPPPASTSAAGHGVIRDPWGKGGWGERWDSNPRHPRPQPGALPTELRPPSEGRRCR